MTSCVRSISGDSWTLWRVLEDPLEDSTHAYRKSPCYLTRRRRFKKSEWLGLYRRLAAVDPRSILRRLRLLLIYGVLYLDLKGVRLLVGERLLVTLQQRFLCKKRSRLSVRYICKFTCMFQQAYVHSTSPMLISYHPPCSYRALYSSKHAVLWSADALRKGPRHELG